MSTTNHIIWHQLPTETNDGRIARLNEQLHSIFFESKQCCSQEFIESDEDGFSTCQLCRKWAISGYRIEHGTPRFLQSLDAMRLIAQSGKFAEVREEFYHWLTSEGKPAYECTIFLYRRGNDRVWFKEKGYTKQQAFYLTALLAMGYMVVIEGLGA